MDGKELKSLLEKKGIKQTELAVAMGVTKQTVNQLMKVADVKSGILENICRKFNIDMNYFFPEFGPSVDQVTPHENYLRALIELKDERIKYLEEQLALLKQQIHTA